MNQITRTEKLADKIYLFDVKAERIAARCLPGQFVIVRSHDDSERIPLTICDYDRKEGTITLVFPVVGAGTHKLSQLKKWEYVHDVAGPLGCASELCSTDIEKLKSQNILFVAGGLGTAPVFPQVNGFVKTVLTVMLSSVLKQKTFLLWKMT